MIKYLEDNIELLEEQLSGYAFKAKFYKKNNKIDKYYETKSKERDCYIVLNTYEQILNEFKRRKHEKI